MEKTLDNAKLTGVKLSCIHKNGLITTWHDTARSIEQVIDEVKKFKNWIGGEFEWIRLEYDLDGKYIEKFVDHKKYNYLLKT